MEKEKHIRLLSDYYEEIVYTLRFIITQDKGRDISHLTLEEIQYLIKIFNKYKIDLLESPKKAPLNFSEFLFFSGNFHLYFKRSLTDAYQQHMHYKKALKDKDFLRIQERLVNILQNESILSKDLRALVIEENISFSESAEKYRLLYDAYCIMQIYVDRHNVLFY